MKVNYDMHGQMYILDWLTANSCEPVINTELLDTANLSVLGIKRVQSVGPNDVSGQLALPKTWD